MVVVIDDNIDLLISRSLRLYGVKKNNKLSLNSLEVSFGGDHDNSAVDVVLPVQRPHHDTNSPQWEWHGWSWGWGWSWWWERETTKFWPVGKNTVGKFEIIYYLRKSRLSITVKFWEKVIGTYFSKILLPIISFHPYFSEFMAEEGIGSRIYFIFYIQ